MHLKTSQNGNETVINRKYSSNKEFKEINLVQQQTRYKHLAGNVREIHYIHK